MPLYLFYTIVQKSQKRPKTQIKGVLPKLSPKRNILHFSLLNKRFLLFSASGTCWRNQLFLPSDRNEMLEIWPTDLQWSVSRRVRDGCSDMLHAWRAYSPRAQTGSGEVLETLSLGFCNLAYPWIRKRATRWQEMCVFHMPGYSSFPKTIKFWQNVNLSKRNFLPQHIS